MAAIQLKTFKDMVDAVREEVKIQSTDTSTINRIKRDINMIYVNEVASANRWAWLRKQFDCQTVPAFFLGTSSVISNSNTVTLTQSPATSKRDFYFSTVEYGEVYKIKSHVAGTSTIKLDRPYMGTTDTAARFWIWTDAVALPTEVRETQEAWTDYSSSPLLATGFQDFRNSQQIGGPQAEGRPELYSTTGYVDPDPFSAIATLPSVATRSSTGYTRSLKFSATLGASGSELIEKGDKIRITGAGNAKYNGEFIVKAVSTTDTTNDTIQYVARTKRTETAIAATSTVVESVNQEEETERFRQMLIYPALLPTKTTIHIEAIIDARAMVEDDDEPLVPIEDRAIILYGALSKAWARERNLEESARNESLFSRKLNQMIGQMEDSYEQPLLEVDEGYLRRKRAGGTRRTPRRT